MNNLFAGEKYIETLEYGPTEHDGDSKEDKRVIFDLHCRGSKGEYFIIEMQRIRQEYFKDGALYYTSRLIQRQLPKGRGHQQLPASRSFPDCIFRIPQGCVATGTLQMALPAQAHEQDGQ